MTALADRNRTTAVLLVAALSALGLALPGAGQEPAEAIEVTIDIKPGDEPTVMDPSSEGMIPVAILSSPDFDATSVDPGSVRFGANGDDAAPVRTITEDVDQDGDTDIMFLFRARQTNIACGDTSASLTGKTRSGQAIAGSESFITEGCRSMAPAERRRP